MHNISITLKSLKYRHLTLYLKSTPHHHTHTHTHREVVLSPKHQHTSTLTPLSLVKSGPQHRSLSLCLSESRACTHLFPHSLGLPLSLLPKHTHYVECIFPIHTKRRPQTSISLVMWFSRTHLTHHPHCKQAHFVSLCTTLLFLSLPHADPPQLLPCIHICRDSLHSSLMYNRSRFRTLFSTPSILDLS